MANQQHLSKAPIEEALIDIRVTLPKHTRECDSNVNQGFFDGRF